MKGVFHAKLILVVLAGLVLGAAALLQAQTLTSTLFRASDPGVRGGPAGAGGPIDGQPPLTGRQTDFSVAGKEEFEQAGDLPHGAGRRMNLDSCGGCDTRPGRGRTSRALKPQVNFDSQADRTDHWPLRHTE